MKLENYSDRELELELERRHAPPEILEFTAYLHGDYERQEWHDYIENVTGYAVSDKIVTGIINALYEVGIPMTINTKTEEVTGKFAE